MSRWAARLLLPRTATRRAPIPPPGFKLREVARPPTTITRLTSDGTGKSLYALDVDANVYRIDIRSGAIELILKHDDFPGLNTGTQALGILLDHEKRLYVVANTPDFNVRPQLSHAVIFRTTALKTDPKPWLAVTYPYGIDTFNHGVSQISIGPDGFLYISSGSRTDHGEKGDDPNRSTDGETPLTACVWRVDPKSDSPKIEIYARGLRNMWGFCWDDRGRMWGTENGPNHEAPEEMNLIEPNHHYGFPYVFSAMDHKLYPDQPDAPKALTLTPPVVNDGPAGGAGLGTFENHSSPSGIIQLGAPFPKAHRGAFLVTRFGNFLGDHDVGFDVLEVRVHEPAATDGRLHATVTQFLETHRPQPRSAPQRRKNLHQRILPCHQRRAD